MGFSPGIERALWLMGLTTGGVQRVVGLNMLTLNDEKVKRISSSADVLSRQVPQQDGLTKYQDSESMRDSNTMQPTTGGGIDIQHLATIADI